MNAMFVVARGTGSGSANNPYRAWFDYTVHGWSGLDIRAGADLYFAGNVFDADQTKLDSIAADLRTEFTIPVTVSASGWDLSFDDIDVPPGTRGKITAWLAKVGKGDFGQARRRRAIAKRVMEEVSGIPGVDPLERWRVTNWPKALD